MIKYIALCLFSALFSTQAMAAMPTCVKPNITQKPQFSVTYFGAMPSDGQPDEAGIQTAMDTAAEQPGGAVVYFPTGNYSVSVNSLHVPSHVYLKFATNAKVFSRATALTSYDVFKVLDSVDVVFDGGVIDGGRGVHLPSAPGEHGMGIGMYGAYDVKLFSTYVINAYGDGFYVGSSVPTPGVTKRSERIALCGTTSDTSRRNGLSVVSGLDILVSGGTYKQTQGTAPQCGIDIEPNLDFKVDNITVIGANINNNKHCGISMGFDSSTSPAAHIWGAKIQNNNIHHNGTTTVSGNYGMILFKQVDAIVSGNTFNLNDEMGLYVDGLTTGSNIYNNIFTTNGAFGLAINSTGSPAGNTIYNNQFSGHSSFDAINWSAGLNTFAASNTHPGGILTKSGF